MIRLPTHETRGERYVALLRERFGPDAADRIIPAGTPVECSGLEMVTQQDLRACCLLPVDLCNC